MEPFGGTRLVPREVVALKKHGVENGVIWIYACVNDGNDSRAAYIKAIVRVGEADDLSGRLGRLTVRDLGGVITHQRGVVKARRDVVDGRPRHRQQLVGLDALNSPKGVDEIYSEVPRIGGKCGG